MSQATLQFVVCLWVVIYTVAHTLVNCDNTLCYCYQVRIDVFFNNVAGFEQWGVLSR
jgi:hypothetical protein